VLGAESSPGSGRVILACNLVDDGAWRAQVERSENGPEVISQEGDS
jgi:hypothetical protein